MSHENVTPLAGEAPESTDQDTRALEVLRDLHPDIALGIVRGGGGYPSAKYCAGLINEARAVVSLLSTWGRHEGHDALTDKAVEEACYLATRLLTVALKSVEGRGKESATQAADA